MQSVLKKTFQKVQVKMDLNQIAKKFEQKSKQRDRKGILRTLKKMPDVYASLIDHPNLQILKDECLKLEAKVEKWWPALTGKFYDKESLACWSESKPISKHRTVVDDIHAFAELLRSFAKKGRKGMSLAEANYRLQPILKRDPHIKTKPASIEVGCSKSTIVKTPIWKAVKGELNRGRKPRVQRLTDLRKKITHVEDVDLQKLIDDQEKDDKQRKVYPSI